MRRIWNTYLKQRFIIDILIYSYTPLLIAVLLAARPALNIALLMGVVANYLLYVVSFLYNDVEDRVEDAKSPGKRFRNPFGYGDWSLQTGYLLILLLTLASLVMAWLTGGLVTTVIALTNFIAGILYSNKQLRLKNYLVIDFISHSYLLAGVQVLYFLSLPASKVDTASILIGLATVLFSIGGDLENEYRDFADDRSANLRNTAYYLGESRTYFISRLMWAFSGLMVLVGLILIVKTQ